MKLILSAMVAMLLATASYASTATVLNCVDDNPDVTDRVEGNAGCQTISDSENVDDSDVANALNLFDHDEWTFISKSEWSDSSGYSPTAGWSVIGDSQGGFIEFAQSLLDEWGAFMLVFKDGTVADPANQVAYLFTTIEGVINYLSPFFNGDRVKDISFISLFGTNSGPGVRMTPVPLPPGFLLMGSGLALIGGFGAYRARKKSLG